MKGYKEIIKMKTTILRKIVLIHIVLFRIAISTIHKRCRKTNKKYIIPFFYKIEKLIYNSACNIFDIS
jgi:hypothetical protein